MLTGILSSDVPGKAVEARPSSGVATGSSRATAKRHSGNGFAGGPKDVVLGIGKRKRDGCLLVPENQTCQRPRYSRTSGSRRNSQEAPEEAYAASTSRS